MHEKIRRCPDDIKVIDIVSGLIMNNDEVFEFNSRITQYSYRSLSQSIIQKQRLVQISWCNHSIQLVDVLIM
jgi:hypothetical protein